MKDSESVPLDNVNEGNISDCIQENEDNENEIISNKVELVFNRISIFFIYTMMIYN